MSGKAIKIKVSRPVSFTKTLHFGADKISVRGCNSGREFYQALKEMVRPAHDKVRVL